MAITMTRDEMVAEARRLVGKTDASKGGASDVVYARVVNQAAQDFCVDSESLRTVKYYSTKQNDKYLPLDRETIWPIQVVFIPLSGDAYALDITHESIPQMNSGNPRVWWPTAVNVPDATGPSTRSIGIDPVTPYVGASNVKIECFQLPVELTAAGSVSEIFESFHQSVCARAAWLIVPQYRDLQWKLPYLQAEYARGLNRAKAIASMTKNIRPASSDVMRYGRMARTRIPG